MRTCSAIRRSTEDPREFSKRKPMIIGERRFSMPRIKGRIMERAINGAKLIMR
jgi:hypothetical protein